MPPVTDETLKPTSVASIPVAWRIAAHAASIIPSPPEIASSFSPSFFTSTTRARDPDRPAGDLELLELVPTKHVRAELFRDDRLQIGFRDLYLPVRQFLEPGERLIQRISLNA